MDLYDELPNSSLLDNPEFQYLLESALINRITVVDFLSLGVSELSKTLQRPASEISKLKSILLKELYGQYETVDKVVPISTVPKIEHFTSGDPQLDIILGGGIYTDSITEIFGSSSTGKSQLLMQLSLTVQLSRGHGGLEGKCVYITTEGELATQRIAGIIAARPEFQEAGASQENIYTVSCPDLEFQEHILNVQLPILLEQCRGTIKLVIIDSISHHMRVELGGRTLREIQNSKFYIESLAQRLLCLAQKHSLAIVVGNQVGDKVLENRINYTTYGVTDYEYQLGWIVGWRDSSILFRQRYIKEKVLNNRITTRRRRDPLAVPEEILSDDEDSMLVESAIRKAVENRSELDSDINKRGGVITPLAGEQRLKTGVDILVPNLGLSWANHISTRILLKKTYKAAPSIKDWEVTKFRELDPGSFWRIKRTLKVVFSTFSKPGEVNFLISDRGVEATS